MSEIHKKYLLKAHSLAYKNFGKTFPNPSVGCLIVKNNKIISKAVTAPAGRPHAEEIALKKAGSKSYGGTMYVTLEPCYHKSHYGSCTDQIIKSYIKKIFIARVDPDPRTNNKSIKKLEKNNIYTNVGMTEEKTNLLNKFFFDSLKNNRPYVKVKMAISNDEKIAYSDYSSKWISNSKSRIYAHKLRYQSQAILTTAKTIIKDNPRFTVRSNNLIIKHLPIIIIDNSLKIPLKSKILKNISKKRIIIFTSRNNKKLKTLKKLGCEVYLMKRNVSNKLNLKTIMKKILSININNILVEAGGIFFTELLSKKLVDELHVFKASFNIGELGKPVIIGKKIDNLKFQEITKKNFGKDVYHHFSLKN
ncbi:MAG: bifunctional diaminohydroxyphosphoribosylaminopyrimidine deaminase/5-amino-6-(5-phosphoribosylamino)uracil reductase RibD [Pelagibacteraceae bacterium]|nr:bifunctional diaminohydroxyphosphoribosylaminopyrimidine deaminase/5-amino-6-(5-phosphoribosylamino)uracil reductase RibD [Pelagibacteraceae bacterium]HJO14122.1 bifunctional diaminohydroxyphosphoribosylaminopyrimidine deaminase/5-amino-6-(5-phosphoribosylamino)uracil reductase RibD [Alphaproteobacteria bacterium]MBO6468239.1 bifunctional diaminohydroxyphosphoribosylaminopyrimidine deaminase/5-amino-6-(5-phosphoribosylamino)uracil reductase RibD [Pelagibacteraceae bacterium]MBO6469322.1 bifun